MTVDLGVVMQHENWQCAKCGNAEFDTGQMRAEGGALSAIFDVSTNKFTLVSCTRCGYSELYKVSGRGLTKALDLFTT